MDIGQTDPKFHEKTDKNRQDDCGGKQKRITENIFLPYIYITAYYKCDLESETEIAQVEQNRESRNRPRQIQDFGRGDITNQWVKGALLYK